jgi:hypothetical protein
MFGLLRLSRMVAAMAGVALGLTLAAPAHADGQVTVRNSSGQAAIDPTYQTTLTVSGRGFQSIKKGHGGIYVQFGAVRGQWRPSQGGVSGQNYFIVPDSEAKQNNGYLKYVAFPGSDTAAAANGGVISPSGTWSTSINVPGAHLQDLRPGRQSHHHRLPQTHLRRADHRSPRRHQCSQRDLHQGERQGSVRRVFGYHLTSRHTSSTGIGVATSHAACWSRHAPQGRSASKSHCRSRLGPARPDLGLQRRGAHPGHPGQRHLRQWPLWGWASDCRVGRPSGRHARTTPRREARHLRATAGR